MALLLPSSRCCTSRMATVSPKLTLNPSNTPCGSAASLTFRTLSSLLSRTTKKGTFDACYDESHPTSGKARGAIGSFPYLYGRRRQRRQHEFEWEKILLSDPNHRHRTSSPNSQLSHRTAVLPSAVSLQHQNEMSMPTSSPAAIFYPFNATKDTTALTLSRFVQEIPRQLVLRKRMNVTAGSPQDPVTSLMRRLNVRTLPIPGPDPPVHNATDPFTHQQPQQISSPLFDPNQAYTRNLIATDHDSYTLLLLCWNPGRFSPIHNHPGDGCWMRLLQGQVQECRYQQQSPHQHKQHQQEPSSSLLFSSECARSSSNEAEIHESSNDPLVCIQDQIFNDTDTVVYINDTLGYHKVGNPSLVQPAMSLHLYSPPIATCKVWSTPTSAPVEMTSNPYHTEYGHRRKPILPIE